MVLRNVKNIEGLEKNVKNIIKAIDENGFINYYGLQRFGTLRPNSHKIGQYILQEDYENAYKEFVTSIYSSESPMAQRAREFLQKTEDLTAAVSEFPKSLKYEIKMIEHLIKNPGDYEGALDTLPPGLKSLLISAFQSWCFNKMISLRSEEGIPLVEPINGDVIGILDEERGNITRVKYLYGGPYDKYLKKAMDLNRAVIVVPLIGYGTDLNDFPAMKNIMNKLIAQESIDLDVFNKKILEKYDFKGSFRAMIVKPMGLKLFKIAEDENNPGKKKIKMEFSLSRGSYATILLREFIK
ncbi:MAG: tRNA pseudouridine(13) synthase TruD [Promethearchaeota archaeon]